MEITLDLKMLDFQELEKKEMKSIDGGSLLLSCFEIAPITTLLVCTEIYIVKEVIEGIGQGWTENKK